MIKAILIDDETHVRQDLRQKIEEHFPHDISIIGEAKSVSEGVAIIQNLNPDLVFLDIDIIGGTGFDVLTQLPSKNFELIFVTGFNDQAIKAIKAGALDYILKPIDDDELIEAINKAIDTSKKDNQLEQLIKISSDYFKGTERKRIILKTSEMVHAVYEDDIIYCESEGNYTTYFTIDSEKIIISKPIKHAEEVLSPSLFIRCHRSFLVNKSHVLKYDKNGFLILNNDCKVPVSTRRKEDTLERIF